MKSRRLEAVRPIKPSRVRLALIVCRSEVQKLEHAVQEAKNLPEELREQIGEHLLHYIHKYLTLSEDLDTGLRELDAGLGVDGEKMFADLKAKYAP